MNTDYQPGTLAPLLPKNKSNARKPNKKLLFTGLGIGLIVLCCVALAVVAVVERSRIPMLANLFATSTPSLTPTPLATLTPTATLTPIPTNTPVLPPISGILQAGSSTSSIASRHIVLCTRQSTSNLDCQLTKLLATSDANGYYEFTNVPTGKYLVFYDAGWSNFDAGLAKWTGQTIHVGDVQWLADNFFEKDSSGNFNIMLPAGAVLDIRVMAYRFFFQSPFFWAHDCGPGSCGTTDDVIPVEFDVTAGGHIQKNFTVYYNAGK
jgi:hypothetical protein